MTDIPHFRVPFTIGTDGSAETVDQDSDEEIAQTVAAILGTRIGEREMVPSFGIDDPAFTAAGEVPPQIVHAVQEWEPRATVDDIAAAINQRGEAGYDVRLRRNEV